MEPIALADSKPPQVLDAAQTCQRLPYPKLIAALRDAFAQQWRAPERHHYQLPGSTDAGDTTLLLMPAFAPGWSGVKIVYVAAANAAAGLPAIAGQYVLSDARTGRTRAIIDGPELTARRTAAASALAAGCLARRDARRLLIIGTGRIARELPHAYACVRPITHVTYWGRDVARAAEAAARCRIAGVETGFVTDLPAAAAEADIIASAVPTIEPIIGEHLLHPGLHLDLIGSFQPNMREVDAGVIVRSSCFVDTFAGALAEAGDLLIPISQGLIGPDHIRADLYGLVQQRDAGRASEDEITLFKSVGSGIEDLAAAMLAHDNESAT